MPLQRFDLSRAEIIACLASGVAYGAAIGWWLWPAAGVFGFFLWFAMSLITLIDLRHFVIPDVLSLPAIPLGLAASIVMTDAPWRDVAVDRGLAVLLAGGALYALRWTFHKYRGVVGLGLGDVKLAAAAGAWLGLEGLPMTLLLASSSALLAAVLQSRIAGREKLSRNTKVPFGAFIAPAIIVIWTLTTGA